MYYRNRSRFPGPKRIEYIGRLVLSAELSLSQMLWPMKRALEKVSDNQVSFTEKEWPIRFSDQVDGDKETGFAKEATNSALPYVWKTYDRFSTLWLVFSLFRSVFHELYLQLLEVINFTPLASHCLDMAKIVIYRPGDRFLTSMLAFVVLGWRLYQRFYNSYSLTIVHQLLEDERRISKFITRYFKSSGEEVNRKIGIGSKQIPAYDRTLRELMCYKNFNGLNENESETIWRLRPNRTLEARKNLIVWIVRFAHVKAVLFFLTAMVPFVLWLLAHILPDIHYVQSYPDCDPELEKLYNENGLALLSFKASPHRLISLVLDLLQAFVLWFDAFSAIFTTNNICFTLEKDLVIYWKEIEKKISLSLELARTLHEKYCTDSYCQYEIDYHNGLFPRQLESSDQLVDTRNWQSQNKKGRSKYCLEYNQLFDQSLTNRKYEANYSASIHLNVPMMGYSASGLKEIEPTIKRQEESDIEMIIGDDSYLGGSSFLTSAKILRPVSYTHLTLPTNREV